MNKKTFEYKGIQADYWTCGSGPYLLWLHGAGLKPTTYIKTFEILSKKYTIIAPTIPYFQNPFDGKEKWLINDLSLFLSEFIKSLKLSDIVVAGHSFGGDIALELAAQLPMVKKLILVSSTGQQAKYTINKISFLFLLKAVRGILKYPNKFVSFIIARDFISEIILNLFKLNRAVNLGQSDYTNELFQVMNRKKTRTIILWGEDDEVFKKDYAHSINKKISNSKITSIDGNHDWCLLKPETIDII